MLKDGFKDEVIIRTSIHFGWRDRLRILLGKNVWLTTRTQCENVPGKMETESSAYVERILPTRDYYSTVQLEGKK